MTRIYIHNLSVIAPGMMGMAQARPILRGEADWEFMAMDKLVPDMLPPNERRRTTALIKLALKAGQEAMPEQATATEFASVFASSEGDLEITDKICRALLLADKPVSPTQFHNSVHNAPAGYWAIAARSQQPSVSLSAADASFVAGLLESASQVTQDHRPVLLIAYDNPAPPLLDACRHFDFPFATAMMLSTEATNNSLATISIELNQDRRQLSPCQNASLESVRQGNPIASSLPLLEAICAAGHNEVVLPYLGEQTVTVQVWH